MPRPTGPSGSKTSNHETNGETNGTVNDDDDDIIMGDLTHPLNDPEQNPVERRMIRSNYRDIISSLNGNMCIYVNCCLKYVKCIAFCTTSVMLLHTLTKESPLCIHVPGM